MITIKTTQVVTNYLFRVCRPELQEETPPLNEQMPHLSQTLLREKMQMSHLSQTLLREKMQMSHLSIIQVLRAKIYL